MSTNKTQNYNLHSWVPEDDFIRSEFNENFTGIDTALKTLSDGIAAETSARNSAVNAEKTAREQAVAAEATARASAVTAEQNARIAAINALTTAKTELVAGVYTGDGTTERLINLGFQPSAVLLIDRYGRMGYNYSNMKAACGGLFLPGYPIQITPYSTDFPIAAETVSTGFKVYQGGCAFANEKDNIYRYIAVK